MYQVANRLISASIVISGLVMSPITALGAQLKQVEWQSDNSGTLRVLVDGDADPSTEILDNGRRLRINLDDTSLGRNAVDVSGQVCTRTFPKADWWVKACAKWHTPSFWEDNSAIGSSIIV